MFPRLHLIYARPALLASRRLRSYHNFTVDSKMECHILHSLIQTVRRRDLGLSNDEQNKLAKKILSALVENVSTHSKVCCNREFKKLLHRNSDMVMAWIRRAPSGVIELHGDINICEVLADMREFQLNSQQTFRNITGHHEHIQRGSWSDNTRNIESLEKYSVAAADMGRRQWVLNGNKWMLNTVHSFFRMGGAAKHFLKDTATALTLQNTFYTSAAADTTSASDVRGNKTVNEQLGALRVWMRSIYPSTGERKAGSSALFPEKLSVLDVGSCYNPLQALLQQEKERNGEIGNIDVLPIDLHPAADSVGSVLQCDFLALNVGPIGSDPVITYPAGVTFTEGNMSSEHAQLDGFSATGIKSFRNLQQLPAQGFNAVCMSLVLSYLPSASERRAMIVKARKLLTRPTAVSIHSSDLSIFSTSAEEVSKACLSYGLLLIVEPYSATNKLGHWIEADETNDYVPHLCRPSDSSRIDSEMSNESRAQVNRRVFVQQMQALGFEHVLSTVLAECGDSKYYTRKAIAMAFRTTSDVDRVSVPRDSRRLFSTLRSGFRQLQRGLHTSDVARNAQSARVLPIGIVGCGIGGAALARKLQREQVPYIVFERDMDSASRKQGYALTLQQGLVALRDMGVIAEGMRSGDSLDRGNGSPDSSSSPGDSTTLDSCDGDGIARRSSYVRGCTSTHSHVSLTPQGKIIGIYGAPSPVVDVPLQASAFVHTSTDLHIDQSIEDNRGVGVNIMKQTAKQQLRSGRKNVHMPRQTLRQALLEGVHRDKIMWQHHLVHIGDLPEVRNYDQRSLNRMDSVHNSPGNECFNQSRQLCNSNGLLLTFDNGRQYAVSGLVGADGIYSTVREQWLLEADGAANTSVATVRNGLNYLGLVVILGICPALVHHNVHTEVDSWTFGNLSFRSRQALLSSSGNSLSRRKVQWLDGSTRVFSMPYDEQRVMWQLSFPMDIADIHHLTATYERNPASAGGNPFKALAIERCGHWHPTLSEMIFSTSEELVTGHPAYDRDPLDLSQIRRDKQPDAPVVLSSPNVTLLGDAWHPMSPFKGQGANEALLDAFYLGKGICKWYRGITRRNLGQCEATSSLVETFAVYENEGFPRSTTKVLKSRRAADYLHSAVALTPGNVTRASAAERGGGNS